jgi:hypothetical protein
LGYEFWLEWRERGQTYDNREGSTTYMVGKVGVHDNDKVTGAKVEAVNVCGSNSSPLEVRGVRGWHKVGLNVPKTELARPRFQNDLFLTVRDG